MRRACIDATGIGMQLAEEAQQDFGKFRVEPVWFTNTSKERMAYELHRLVDEKELIIPRDVTIREDLHSVKKTVTVSNNIRFDAERSEQGHADRFWAAALAGEAAKNYSGPVEVASSGERSATKLLDGFGKFSLEGF